MMRKKSTTMMMQQHLVRVKKNALSVVAALKLTRLAIECVGVTVVTSQDAPTQTTQRTKRVHALSVAAALKLTSLAIECVGAMLVTPQVAPT
mmetsp:Transcript_84902/g.147979  ORF Transcript_84902/g.147979 Transcript_84902/m.147979 type:complete len:92 (+) Transcript_84902:850-1125(+)